jgi:PAS domain S-box-containing protein
MRPSFHSSIQKKLSRIILLTCAAAVVAACAVFAAYDVHMVRQNRLQEFSTLAKITGANSTAAIEFEDVKSASEILQGLRTEKQIVHAALYSASGATIAVYSRDAAGKAFIAPAPEPDGAHFSDNRIEVFQTIWFNGQPVGQIYVESDLSAVAAREWGLIVMISFALLASLLVALLVGPKLQKSISQPILELAQTALAVSVEKNYSIRAVKKSNDEIGFLYEQFNRMLQRVQERDAALEQIRADLELRVSERTAFLSALIDSSPIAIVVSDQHGCVQSLNPAFTNIFGYAREEGVGAILDELIAPGGLAAEAQDLTRRRIAGELFRIETRRKRKDGTLVDVEVHGVPLRVQGKIVGGFALYQDVTDRHRAERAIRDANAKLTAIIQTSPLGIVTTDPSGRIQLCNPAFEQLFQFSGHEAIGAILNDLIVPDELRNEADELTRRGRSGEIIHFATKRRRKDGKLLDVELYGVSLQVGSETTGGLVLYQDISERRRSEEAVREANETLSAIFNASPVPIVGLDLDARIVRWNPAAETVFGWSASEVMGRRPPMVPADQQQMFETMRQDVIEGRGVTGLEVPVQKKDGALIDVSLSRAPLRDASGAVRGTVDILMDITERKRAEKALRESEERFRLIAETITEVFWIADPNISTMDYVSPGYELVWGHSLESLRENPRSFLEAIHPEDRERVISELAVQREGKPFDHEYRILRPDGALRWIWDRGFPVRSPTGEVTRYVGVAKDITERKEAEESLHKLSQALEQSAESVVITDRHGVIEYVNPCFVELTHFSKEEAVGRSPRILKSGNQTLSFYQRMWAKILAGEVFREVFVNKKKTGELFYEEKTIAPLKDERGNITNFVAVGRDITLRRRAEEELRKAKDAAEEANHAKSAFLANMSHEIRTPMNGIIGMTDLALDTELNAEQKEYLEMAKTSAESLLRVINDILDFSKIEAGKLEFEFLPFALRESLGETMKSLGHSAHRKNLELAWEVAPEVPEWIVGDRGRLRQMLVNLAGNAIKFTERGEVVLSVSQLSAGPESVELHFQMRDTGIGIPADKQDKIFGAFTQADSSTTRKYGGTGLGLAIVQRLVSLQGGKLWLESEAGKGSTFHFTLHFGLPGKTFVPPQRPELDGLRGLRVLVVDDNQTNRVILADLLKQWKMQPVEAKTGIEALEILSRAHQKGRSFPLAVIDAQMPTMDGFQLAKRVKEDSRLASMAIIMLSSAALSGEAKRSRDVGIAAYLIKPAQPSELLDSILDALAKPRPLDREPDVNSKSQESAMNAPALRILLAEDNAVNRQLVVRLLEKRGHLVRTAKNGREALEILPNERMDLVLMDMQMPEMDGAEAMRRIRAEEKSTGAHIPIIAVTAHALKGDREKCMEAGADDYISKPIQPAELYGAIERNLAARAGEKQAPGNPLQGSQVEVINEKELLEHVQGDRELLAEMIELFRDEAASLIRDLRDGINRSDATAIGKAAHTLKGALGNFGSGPAYRAAQEMEAISHREKLGDARPPLATLEKEVERLQAALEPFRIKVLK